MTRGRRGAPTRSSGGFTLVEILVVLAVVSILARLALPNFQEAMIRARAAAAFGDVEVVRTAAASFNAKAHTWPPDVPAGVVPPELVSELPEGFTFERGAYQLDWEHWTLPDGLPDGSGPTQLTGVAIATDDELLGNAVAALMGGNGWYGLGNTATFLVER